MWGGSSTYYTPLQEKHVLAHSGADDRMDVSEEDHADSSQAAEPSLPADQGVAALGQEQPAGEDEGDDFRAGTGSDEEDDEATLEEEEVRLPHPPCPCASHVLSLASEGICRQLGSEDAPQLSNNIPRKAAFVVEHDLLQFCNNGAPCLEIHRLGACRLWLVPLVKSLGMTANWRR